MELTIRLRRPHPKQRLFIESPARWKIIRAGRRGGKTTGAAMMAVRAFLGGHRVLYAVPVAQQLEAFWREVKRAMADPITHGVFRANESSHFVELPGTTQRIRAKTAWNADTLRGDYADLLILDEWQLMDESAWGEVGAPMLADNDGRAVFIYTPPSLNSRSVTKARDPRHAAKMFKAAAADTTGDWLAVHFTSHDNPHISARALERLTRVMTGLAYRQEIEAEDVEESPGALWSRKLLEQSRLSGPRPEMERIIIGVDPSGSTTTEAGIVACGVAGGIGYVLEDRSLLAPTPQAWAAAAVKLYYELKADRIVIERNFGGDMAKATIQTIDGDVAISETVSSRAKMVRAEPVAAQFEQGRIKLAGSFPDLEDELCSYTPTTALSPNRLDAMVFALNELLFGAGRGLAEYYERALAEIKGPKATPERPEYEEQQCPWQM